MVVTAAGRVFASNWTDPDWSRVHIGKRRARTLSSSGSCFSLVTTGGELLTWHWPAWWDACSDPLEEHDDAAHVTGEPVHGAFTRRARPGTLPAVPADEGGRASLLCHFLILISASTHKNENGAMLDDSAALA